MNRNPATPAAVLLMNYGGPERPEDCEPYIRNIFMDPDLIPLPGILRPLIAARAARRRAPYLRANYGAMGRMSPILEETEAQAAALQEELGPDFLCLVGMRYWRPTIAEALASLKARDIRRLVLLPLYPQESRTTTGSALGEVARCLSASGYRPETCAIRSFWDEPGFLAAVAAPVRAALSGASPPERILYCAHGLPLSSARGDPYPGQVESTVRVLQERLAWRAPHALAWQSRVGPMRWLRPSVEEMLGRWADEGVRSLLLAPVAFVSEHSETLYELDILYASEARRLGMDVLRAPTVGCSAPFIQGLARRVRALVARPQPGRE